MTTSLRIDRSGSRGPLLVAVLVASLFVGIVIASKAMSASKHRQALGQAVLRQYSQLAAWEFSRLAQRDIDDSLTHTLAAQAHPERSHSLARSECNCQVLTGVEHWIEVPTGGEVRVVSPGRSTTDAAVSVALAELLQNGQILDGFSGESTLRLLTYPGLADVFVAVRPEPHLAPAGGFVGLVARADSLVPVLQRTLERAPLLPAVIAGGRDVRTLVDLQILDGVGRTLIRTPNTVAGPMPIDMRVLPDFPIALNARASMTPEFISGLGPAFGGSADTPIVLALVLLNGLLVAVAIWQLSRERAFGRMRANFVAGVSHELRTPLAQIQMFSEMLLLGRVRSREERQRALQIIRQESVRLGQLAENVLRFSRPQGMQTAPVTIDLGALAADVAGAFGPIAAAKSVTLDVQTPSAPVTVRGDRSALRQVLLNLLDNAVKFGPEAQTITVAVNARETSAVLSVEDRGPGVPDADRTRIFEPFARGTDTRGTGGAGIGLAVVGEVIAAHGGRSRTEPRHENRDTRRPASGTDPDGIRLADIAHRASWRDRVASGPVEGRLGPQRRRRDTDGGHAYRRATSEAGSRPRTASAHSDRPKGRLSLV